MNDQICDTFNRLFYDDLLYYNNQFNSHKNKILEKYTPLNTRSLIVSRSPFFPDEIYKFVTTTKWYRMKYTFNIYDTRICLKFFKFGTDATPLEKKEYNTYLKYIYIWLSICVEHTSTKTNKTLAINIYLTDFKKTLPANNSVILSPEHANTASTYKCIKHGEITIFRKEEWFKVFIHETIHSYCFDFSGENTAEINRIMCARFNINCDFNVNLSEAYTETWARVINSVIYAFFSMGIIPSKQEFIKNVKTSLNKEIEHSLIQAQKVLAYMGLTFGDLNVKGGRATTLYKENTNIFGYYILTAIMLNDYIDFIQWCFMNNICAENMSIFKFDTRLNQLNDFMIFIINKSNVGSFQKRIQSPSINSQAENMNMNMNMNMTVCELMK